MSDPGIGFWHQRIIPEWFKCPADIVKLCIKIFLRKFEWNSSPLQDEGHAFMVP
jgi:hypothetical protein